MNEVGELRGPDLPASDELFEVAHWHHRWPCAEKVELIEGILIFQGEYDRRDVETARRTYPGRHIVLNSGGGLEVHPALETAQAPAC